MVENHVDNAEERLLEARAVLNLPGYRENKVRTLLLRNHQLEQELKVEKDNARNLIRINKALEEHVQLLKGSVSSDVPRTTPARATTSSMWNEKEEDKMQQQELAFELQGKVSKLNREVSDIYGELQRCLAEQKRLEVVASQVFPARARDISSSVLMHASMMIQYACKRCSCTC